MEVESKTIAAPTASSPPQPPPTPNQSTTCMKNEAATNEVSHAAHSLRMLVVYLVHQVTIS